MYLEYNQLYRKKQQQKTAVTSVHGIFFLLFTKLIMYNTMFKSKLKNDNYL